MIDIDTRPAIVRIVQDAKCNGGDYREPTEHAAWPWPRNGFLTRRLRELKERDQQEEK